MSELGPNVSLSDPCGNTALSQTVPLLPAEQTLQSSGAADYDVVPPNDPSVLPSLETHPVSTTCIYGTCQQSDSVLGIHKHNESDNFMCLWVGLSWIQWCENFGINHRSQF